MWEVVLGVGILDSEMVDVGGGSKVFANEDRRYIKRISDVGRNCERRSKEMPSICYHDSTLFLSFAFNCPSA